MCDISETLENRSDVYRQAKKLIGMTNCDVTETDVRWAFEEAIKDMM